MTTWRKPASSRGAQLLGRLAVARPRRAPADQHHVGRRVGLELVLDRLHDVLVADPRLGLDPGLGERGDRRDQVALGRLAGRLDVGGPAVEEADPGRGEDEHVDALGSRSSSPAGAGDLLDRPPAPRPGRWRRAGRGGARRAARRRDDRPARALAHRDDHDRHRDQPARAEADPAAADVEAGDDRQQDRGDTSGHFQGVNQIPRATG